MSEAAKKPELTAINPPERQRVYHYADGSKVEFGNVTKVGVRESGSHRIETADGKKYVVLPGWRYLELDIDEWTF